MAISSDFRSYKCDAAVAGHLIVKPGTTDYSCDLATAATDKLLGSTDPLDKAINEEADVYVGAIGKVRAGGNVVRGDALTANASSKAIATTTSGNRIIGFAEQSGAADDIITYRVAPGVY